MLEFWQSEIEAGNMTLFMIDECHLLWGDILGYGWGKTEHAKINLAQKCKIKIDILWCIRLSKKKEFIVQ